MLLAPLPKVEFRLVMLVDGGLLLAKGEFALIDGGRSGMRAGVLAGGLAAGVEGGLAAGAVLLNLEVPAPRVSSKKDPATPD